MLVNESNTTTHVFCNFYLLLKKLLTSSEWKDDQGGEVEGDKLLIHVFYNTGTVVDNQLLKKKNIYTHRIHASACKILVPLTAFFK